MSRAMTIFQGLREDLARPALASLRAAVRSHHDELVRAQRKDELVAIDLAEQLGARLEQLLAVAHDLAPEARMGIVGAARYFVSTADAIPDGRACTGLDDDVEVFNHVARSLGRPELVITE